MDWLPIIAAFYFLVVVPFVGWLLWRFACGWEKNERGRR